MFWSTPRRCGPAETLRTWLRSPASAECRRDPPPGLESPEKSYRTPPPARRCLTDFLLSWDAALRCDDVCLLFTGLFVPTEACPRHMIPLSSCWLWCPPGEPERRRPPPPHSLTTFSLGFVSAFTYDDTEQCDVQQQIKVVNMNNGLRRFLKMHFFSIVLWVTGRNCWESRHMVRWLDGCRSEAVQRKTVSWPATTSKYVDTHLERSRRLEQTTFHRSFLTPMPFSSTIGWNVFSTSYVTFIT